MPYDFYRTKDLSLAAFLYTSGKKLNKLDFESGRAWFIFDDQRSCDALVSAFWRKEATVNAKEFADAIRSLKDLMFCNQKTSNGYGYGRQIDSSS